MFDFVLKLDHLRKTVIYKLKFILVKLKNLNLVMKIFFNLKRQTINF